MNMLLSSKHLMPMAQRHLLYSSQAIRTFSTWQDKKNLKFDAFNKEGSLPKDYSVKDEWKLKMNKMAEPFVPKPEFDHTPFDPNTRHNMEDVSNDLIYKALDIVAPKLDPQSCYVSIQHKGKTYHLFDASRIPLGRMAKMCAVFIRGKNKPTYDPQNSSQGDICVIVNASKPLVGGKKMQTKKYRHHTQYFSGFREINMEKLLLKDPA
jgi:hypothetical protein